MAKRKSYKKKNKEVPVVEQVTNPVVSKQTFPWVALIISFLAGIVLYGNTVNNEYAIDDTLVITENSFTKLGYEGVDTLLVTDAFVGHFGDRGNRLVGGGRYRPLSIVTFALEYEWFGDNATEQFPKGKVNPSISHAINALLYGLTGALLYLLLFLLFPKVKSWWWSMPFLATLIYLCHPIHTEAVANIKGRDEIMAMLFCIGTLLCLLLSMRIKKFAIVLLVASPVMYFLALLSKENSITFLAVIPLTLYCFTKADLKRHLISAIPLVAVAGLFLYMRNEFTNTEMSKSGSFQILNDPFIFSSFAEQYGTIAISWLKYVQLLIFPLHLSHDYYPYQLPVVSLYSLLPMLAVVFHLVIGIAGVWLVLKKKHVVGFALLYYLITFSVVSQFFFTVGTNMSERFLYMPSLGFAILLAWGFIYLSNWQKGKFKMISMVTLGAILLLYSVKTIDRNADWKDNFTLFAADIDVASNSAKLNMAYGGELIAQADRVQNETKKSEMLNLAIVHLQKSIEIYPDTIIVDANGKERPIGFANAYNLLGNAFYTLDGTVERAEHAYLSAHYYQPGHFDAFQNLAAIYSNAKMYDKAVPYLESLVNTQPSSASFINQLALAYRESGASGKSIQMFQRYADLSPALAAHGNYQIATTYARFLNDIEASIPYFQKAIELDGSKVEYLEDLGVAYGFLGKTTEAIDIFERIIEINPDHANAHLNLSVSYRNTGDEEKSQYHYERAKAINPNI